MSVRSVIPVLKRPVSTSGLLPFLNRKQPSSLLSSQFIRKQSTMLEGCVFKKTLLKGEGASMGLWQTLPGANISRILARSGVDWVMVDCEHGNIDGVCRVPYIDQSG